MIEGIPIHQANGSHIGYQDCRQLDYASYAANIPPREVYNCSPESITRYFVPRWRVQVTILQQRAIDTWDGFEALDLLQEARDIMKAYYNHPYVQMVAGTEIETTNKKPPLFASMNFDRGNHYLILSGLSSRRTDQEAAARYFSLAAFQASSNTELGGLATHQQRLLRENLGTPPWENGEVKTKLEGKSLAKVAQKVGVAWMDIPQGCSLPKSWIKNWMRNQSLQQTLGEKRLIIELQSLELSF